MSVTAIIRSISSPVGFSLQADGPVRMEDVIAGPVKQLYAAGAVQGPVLLQLSSSQSEDGRLPEAHLSISANDSDGAFDASERIAVRYQESTAPAETPRDAAVESSEAAPTDSLRNPPPKASILRLLSQN